MSSSNAAPNPDVGDVGCPSCDYGLPYPCNCEEDVVNWGEDEALALIQEDARHV